MQKKLISILLLSLSFQYQAHSSLSVEWRTDQVILNAGSIPGSPVPLSDNSLYFLFYTPDTQINLDPSNFNGNVSEQRGNDKLVSVARSNFQLASIFLNFTTDATGTPLNTPGYFYSLVVDFNDPSLVTSNPSTWDISIPNGTLGFLSNLSPLVPFDDLTTPTVVNANSGGTWTDPGFVGSAVANVALIPEPGTLALIVMAAGGIAMKLRRRRG